jgi:amino acid adenylation domain-containing protein
MSGRSVELPLSYGQERLWFLQQLMPGTDAYHVPMVWRLRGDVSVTALRRALHRIAERHEVLRTTFPARDGQPVQLISERAGLDLPVVDLTGDPDDARARAVADEVARPFRLTDGPLIRALLIRSAADDHTLVVTTHHIVFDGSSEAVFYRELDLLYTAYRAGLPDPLPALAIQYGDYAAWQRERAGTDEQRRQIAWWREQLTGAPWVLDLPVDRARPPVQRYAGAVVDRVLPAASWQRVLDLARTHRVTPFMVLLAGYAVLLAQLGGRADVVAGAPVAQRGRPELDPLIGMFANLLPLRVRAGAGASFAEVLGQVRDVCVGAFARTDVPFEALVEELRPPRSTSHNPLVQAVFAPLGEPPVQAKLGDLAVEPVELPLTTVKFDLVLTVVPTSGTAVVKLAYRRDLFDEPTVARIADAYVGLLDTAVARPESTVAALPRPAVHASPAPVSPVTPEVTPSASGDAAPGLPELRRQVSAIWCEVLRLDRIDPDDNFFDVGGNSLLLARAHARLVTALDRQVPLLTLYHYPTVAALVRHLRENAPAREQDSLESAVRAGRQRLHGRRGRLAEWAAPPEAPAVFPDPPPDLPVHRLFEWQARMRPGTVAVSTEHGSLSYADLNDRADGLARRLHALGVRGESLVGVLLERSADFVVAILAVLKAGGAYVPLDPDYPRTRLATMVRQAGVALVLTRQSLAPALAGTDAEPVCLDRPDPDPDPDLAPVDPEPDPGAGAGATGDGSAIAYVMFTSGSTGEPKGVAVTHRGVVRLVRDADYAHLGPDEVMLHQSSVSFDASTFELWGALLTGGRLVCSPPGPPALDDIGTLLRTAGVTVALFTTGLFHLMVDERPDDLAGLRQVLVGGDALSAGHVARALARVPGCRIINAYGPTEATTMVTTYPVPAGFASDAAVPIGRPIRHAVIRILDDYLQLTPIGVPGQLYAGGDGLARGYLGDPARTAERFVPDPFAAQPGSRLYATGDRARYLADGTIEFLGRLDDQVKIRGFRVEPGEVEALLRTHPRIRGAVVVPHGDTAERRRLVAYLVLAGGTDPDEIRSWLRDRVPAHLVPEVWMPVGSLPLTPNGKVDRARLPAPVVQARRRPAAERLEQVIAVVWAEVLGVDRVEPHDDFFDLGGYSIVAMKVLMRLHQVLGVDLPLSALFDYPTVADLAGFIRATTGAGDAVTPI